MKLIKPIPTVVLTGLLCSTAFCSRELLVPTHKISISANAEKPFGEVNATIETTSSLYNRRIKSIVLSVGGKKHIVPQASFKNLQHPLIETAAFTTEAGSYDGGSRWLYLRLKLDMPNTKSPTDYKLFYVTFRNGKLQGTDTFTYNL